MSWILLIVCVAFWLYTFHLKDIYYGFGRAVVLINEGAIVKYNDDMGLSFERGNCTEHYIGNLGATVYKLLLRNGHIEG